MKTRAGVHLPTPTELGEFGRSEFANGVADVRRALIDEAWFGRSTSIPAREEARSLGWELPGEQRSEPRNEDPFGHRWSASDQAREPAERDQPHELDFDR